MHVTIVDLTTAHIGDLVRLYEEAPPDYSRYFHPFTFDSPTLMRLLASRQRDLYYVVLADGEVAGYYMLRGFDEGYRTPAYGVWISPLFSGHGLARATLEHAVTVCRQLGCKDVMLKVHPQNRRAKALYERFGFRQVGADSANQNFVYC